MLIGWQFTAGEFVGGPIMIVLIAVLFRRFLSRRLVEEARQHAGRGSLGRMEGHAEMDMSVSGRRSVWRRGSVIGSWLLDLTASALLRSPTLEEFSGRVSDSGEGRWTSIAAIDEGVPAPVLTSALYSRFSSRGLGDFAYRVLSAQRKEFGGHAEKAGS